MIASLDDAWRWYESVKSLTGDMARLGRRYWNLDEWANALSEDNRFRFVEAPEIEERATRVVNDLDDLGVLLLFSVFEAMVRAKAQLDVKDSLPEQLHPAVGHAIEELLSSIEHGSFGKVTEAFKRLDHDLIEEVNQVRRYRNWVAHGRRGEQPSFVDPPAARDRLDRFLRMMEKAADSRSVDA
jgi:hypothetical protein